ncbi:hypothetical protein BVY03_00105, partial [bacterium K02(2017)]
MLKSFALPALMAISFSFVNPCSNTNQGQQPNANDTIHDVQVIYPQFKSVSKTHQLEGVFDPSELTSIIANAPGKIEQIYVSVGDTVQKNDPISSIENTQISELIDIKRSRISELQARLEQAKEKIGYAEGEDVPTTIEDTLFLDEEPIDEPADKNYGDANATTTEHPKSVKTLIDVLEKSIESLTKQANALDRHLLDLTQNSPVNGIVTKIYLNEQNKVNAKDKIVEIAKMDPISVTFHLPGSVANFIDKNSKVRVSPVDAIEVVGKGNVYFINPNINPDTNTIEVKAHVANPDNKIKGGQNAKVSVSTRKVERVIVLPKNVLYYENDESFVFIAYRNQAKLVQVSV